MGVNCFGTTKGWIHKLLAGWLGEDWGCRKASQWIATDVGWVRLTSDWLFRLLKVNLRIALRTAVVCVCVCQEEASVGKDSERGCGDDEGVIDYHRLTNYSVYLIIFRVILHLWSISKGKIWWPWCQILARPIEIQLHILDVNVRSLKLTRQQPRRFPLEWQKKKLRLDEMHPLKLHDRKRNMQQPNFHGFPPAFVRMSYFSCLFDAVLIAWGQSKGRCHSSYQGPNLIKNHQNMNRQSWLCSRSAFEVSFSANLRILISGRCSERSGWSPTGLGCSGSIPRCEKALQVLKNAWFLRFFNDYLIWFRFLSFCFFPHHLWLLLTIIMSCPFLPLQGGLPEKIEDDTHPGGWMSGWLDPSWKKAGMQIHGCAGQGASKSTRGCALGLWGYLRNASVSAKIPLLISAKYWISFAYLCICHWGFNWNQCCP